MQTSVQIIDDRATVKLIGRFDIATFREFRKSCDFCLSVEVVKEVLLDLQGVEFIDSSALGMMLTLKSKADGLDKRVVLSNCPEHIKIILGTAQFGRIFRIA